MLHPESFKEHDQYNRKNLSSSVRDWKITSTKNNQGSYKTKPQWKITAADVVKGGLGDYIENVKKWSESVLESLKESGNL